MAAFVNYVSVVGDVQPSEVHLERVVDRLEWSWRHLQQFKLRLSESGVRYHWVKGSKVETETGGYVDFIVDKAEPIPGDAALILGDCIHSLCASLDNLIYLLCPTDCAEFLVCLTPKKWSDSQWKIRTLGPGPRAALHSLQPFQPKHAPDPEGCLLWILDRLWNDDKHRAPHIVNGIIDQAVLSSDPPGWLHAAQVLGGPLQVGSVVQRVWYLPGSEPRLKVEFGFDVAFDAMGPARGRSAYYFLVELHNYVAQVVELFRRFFV